MKILLSLTLLLFSLPAQARVDGRFLSFIGMVAVNDRVMGKITDDDPQRLFAAMNVKEEEKDGKRAKVIRLGGKKFTLLCSEQGGGATVCTMVVKQGPQGTVSSALGLIRFVALGEEAASLREFFHAPKGERFEYLSADQSLSIAADDASFVAEFKKP